MTETEEPCNGGDVSMERIQTGHLNTKGADSWFPLSVVFSTYSPIFLFHMPSFEANHEGQLHVGCCVYMNCLAQYPPVSYSI